MLRPVVLFVLALCASGILYAQPAPIVAETGAPEFFADGWAKLDFPVDGDQYLAAVRDRKRSKSFIAISKFPQSVSPRARFGTFRLGPNNVGYVVDGDAAAGYVLTVDFDADGDLTDESPLRMERLGDRYTALISRAVTDFAWPDGQIYPIESHVEVAEVVPPEGGEKRLALSTQSTTLRRGTIALATRRVAFALISQDGLFSGSWGRVVFDVDGDGTLKLERDSTESYRVPDHAVNLDGLSYAFSVDRYGRSLTLTPLAEKKPDRIELVAGYPAPEFSATDTAGKTHRLADYRGRVLLIDFWGTWCKGCVAAVPRLVETYRRHHARGFDIIGVASGAQDEEMARFTTAHGMEWPEVFDEFSGPLHKLFRVEGAPTYFLIGTDGKILATDLPSAEEFAAILDKQLPAARDDSSPKASTSPGSPHSHR